MQKSPVIGIFNRDVSGFAGILLKFADLYYGIAIDRYMSNISKD